MTTPDPETCPEMALRPPVPVPRVPPDRSNLKSGSGVTRYNAYMCTVHW
eukprot:COSAG02_NODE_3439_length_6743_cov_9.291541_9_plen_49_part_00